VTTQFQLINIIIITSALDGGGWLTPRSVPFTHGKRLGIHRTGCWVGPRAVLDACEIHRL